MTPEEIKSIRLACALTQSAIAHDLGIHPRSYRRLESGQCRPSGPVVVLLRQMQRANRRVDASTEAIRVRLREKLARRDKTNKNA